MGKNPTYKRYAGKFHTSIWKYVSIVFTWDNITQNSLGDDKVGDWLHNLHAKELTLRRQPDETFECRPYGGMVRLSVQDERTSSAVSGQQMTAPSIETSGSQTWWRVLSV